MIRDRDIGLMLDAHVQAEWFVSDADRAVWTFIRQHFGRYGEVPTAVTVRDNFPTYRLLKVDDAPDYLLDQLLAYRRRQTSIRVIQDAGEAIQGGDHEQAIGVMTRGLAGLGEASERMIRELDLTKDAMSRWDAYVVLKTRGDGLLGVPTGFRTIDEATAGLQPGQLITIIAPPKTGKSVLALQIASTLHDADHCIYFQSFEMSNAEQQTRHDAFRSKISHARLVRGALEDAEEVRYNRMLHAMDVNPVPFVLADSTSGITVSTIENRIRALDPAVIFIDGVYLMLDEVTGEQNTPQALTNLTRALKKLGQRLGKPVVITTQVLTWKMKGRQVTADAIGYSSSFFQDSDVILGLQRDEDDDDDVRILKIVASRNCGPAEVDLVWDWATGTFAEYGMDAA